MRLLYTHSCKDCGEKFGLAISWESALFSPKKCADLLIRHDTQVLVHASSHKIEGILKGVKYE
jgi:hypothetical protein